MAITTQQHDANRITPEWVASLSPQDCAALFAVVTERMGQEATETGATAMAKDLSRLSAAALNALRDKTCERAHNANRALIAAGRGNETGQETRGMCDPLALEYIASHDEFNAINGEIDARRRWHGSDKPIRKSRLA